MCARSAIQILVINIAKDMNDKNPRSLIKRGEKNPIWKGDKVGYTALHAWVRRNFPKQEKCNSCKIVSPIDLANISQKYKRDLSDWEWLCRKCHMRKDGRMNGLLSRNKRKSHYLEFQGRTKTIQEWAKEIGVSDTTIRKRFRKNLSLNANV